MSRRIKNSHQRFRSRQTLDFEILDEPPPFIPDFVRKDIKLTPKNLSQKRYIDALLDTSKTVVIGVGPAGVGKTYLAVLHAIKQFEDGEVDRIVLIRPVVTADGSELGALPGGVAEKILPYLGEVAFLLKEHFGVKGLNKMLEEEKIEVLPIAIARGRSLKNSAIIVEEAQNIQNHVMKLLLTRIAFGSRLYLNGDVTQTDTNHNGLEDLIFALEEAGGSSHFAVCHFSEKDVERHPVVSEVLRIYG
jgi:phosphate starvation-inducible protein PhoH and related proteins